MVRIQVVFYGGLKQDVGAKFQPLDIPQEGLTVGELAEVLRERYPVLQPRLSTVAYVVNDEIVSPEYVLHDGDEAAVLPPVSGG